MTPPDRWREAAREIRQAMKDSDLVWSLISEGKLTGILRRLFPAREEQDATEFRHYHKDKYDGDTLLDECDLCGRSYRDTDRHIVSPKSTESERQKEKRGGKIISESSPRQVETMPVNF